MKQNIGKKERLIRVFSGLFLVILGSTPFLSGYFAWSAIFVGIIAFVTGVVGWCGLYSITGISTRGSGINKISRHDIERAVKQNPMNSSSDILETVVPEKKVVKKKKVAVNKKTVVKKASPTKKRTVSKSKK